MVAAFAILWRFFAKPANIEPGYFALAVLLVLPKFADYTTSTRNDTLSLLWEISSFALFSHWWQSRKENYLFLFLFTCLASVCTRQTGVVAFGTAVLWLLLHREWGTAVWLAGIYSALVASFIYAANEITGGAFLDQAFYANLRYLPPQFQFFSLSLITFLLSYVIFTLAFLAFYRRQNFRSRLDSTNLVTLGIFCSGAMALMLFFRAGGDVNYFFETLLLAVPLAALGIRELASRKSFQVACALQMLLIAGVLFLKTKSAAQTAFYPYAEAAARLRLEYEPFGIVDGSLAPALNLHLRGWAYHGPDVTNGGNLGRYSHERTRWVMGDTAIAFRTHQIHTIVVAQPDCAEHLDRAPALPISRKRWNSFSDAEAWYPWLCVYRRPHDPTGKPVEISRLQPADAATH